MSIPTYNEFYESILELLSDGKVHNSKETMEHCATAFHLSAEDRMRRLPSNRQTVLANRVGWARTYLKKAGLIEAPGRGQYRITESGRAAIKDKKTIINNDYLHKFPGFREFINQNLENRGNSELSSSSVSERTPQEIMDEAYERITGELADELMENIMGQKPAFFERLVMDLLEKWGMVELCSIRHRLPGKQEMKVSMELSARMCLDLIRSMFRPNAGQMTIQ